MPCIFLFLFPKLCPFAVIRQNIFALQSNWLLFKWQPKIAQQHQVYKKKEQRVPQTIFTSALVGINRSKQKAKNKILLTLGVSETAFWSKEKVCGFFLLRGITRKIILTCCLWSYLQFFHGSSCYTQASVHQKYSYPQKAPLTQGRGISCRLQSCRLESSPPAHRPFLCL